MKKANSSDESSYAAIILSNGGFTCMYPRLHGMGVRPGISHKGLSVALIVSEFVLVRFSAADPGEPAVISIPLDSLGSVKRFVYAALLLCTSDSYWHKL